MTEQSTRADLVVDAMDGLGENARWSVRDQRLYWLDIFPKGSRLHAYEPSTGNHEVYVPGGFYAAISNCAVAGLSSSVTMRLVSSIA